MGKRTLSMLLVGATCLVSGLIVGNCILASSPSANKASTPHGTQDHGQVIQESRDAVLKAEAAYKVQHDVDKAKILVGTYVDLVRNLVAKGDIDEAVDALNKALAIEQQAGIGGSEEGEASYIAGFLVDRWIHSDGELFLKYLRSPRVSKEDKAAAMEYLKEVIEKEYPGGTNR